jgi:hypothetical protein
MRILGDSMEKFLSLLILKIILVLYISYLAVKLIADMLVGSTSGLFEHRRENLEKLNQSLIGKNITDPVQNLKKM